MNILEKANQFPPTICRLHAAPATTRQIAVRAGLPRSTIHQISLKTKWDKVPLGRVEKFSRACGVDLLATKRPKQFLAKRSWGFIKRIKPTQRALISRLLGKFKGA
jgi:hypothetical protein